MSSNYWLEQYDKETLAREIRQHLGTIYGVQLHASLSSQEVVKEVVAYLKQKQKTQYRVYVRLDPAAGVIHVEIP